MSSLKTFLGLDSSKASKISVMLFVISIIIFIWWALTVKNIFFEGYREGIKECFLSQEGLVDMLDRGKAQYGDYWNISQFTNMTVEQMIEFMNSFNSTLP